IDKAKHTVFITGWQINYDIHLRKANTAQTEKYLQRRDELQSKLEHEQANLQKLIEQDLPENGFNARRKEWWYNKNIQHYLSTIDSLDEKISASRAEQTLWHCLRAAVKRGVKVYVLP